MKLVTLSQGWYDGSQQVYHIYSNVWAERFSQVSLLSRCEMKLSSELGEVPYDSMFYERTTKTCFSLSFV